MYEHEDRDFSTSCWLQLSTTWNRGKKIFFVLMLFARDEIDPEVSALYYLRFIDVDISNIGIRSCVCQLSSSMSD